VSESLEHDGHDEDEKGFVVFASDAVVEPFAVMVEVLRASSTPSAMLRIHHHMGITELAKQIELVLRKILMSHSLKSFSTNKRVTRVSSSGFNSIAHHQHVKECQNSGNSDFLTFNHDAL
jgi:hypothetical protein